MMYTDQLSSIHSRETCATKDLHHRQRGFALVVALSLMAFVLLLLLSITTIVQVETHSSAISKKTLKARSNAILGLSIALGELQQYAGPDQRVTTTAKITTQLSENSQDGTRYWTGVWGNENGPDAVTRAPILLNWLVSGNQGQTVSVANDGSVTEPATGAIDFSPGGAVKIDGIDTTISNQRGAILLGSGSVELEADYVVAPVVPIDEDSAKGNYAYWVGDEGVKANIGLVKGPELSLNADSSKYGLAAVRRIQANQSVKTSGELIRVDADGADLWGTRFNLKDASFISDLGKLTDLRGLDLVQSVPQSLAHNRFHDLTTHSRGLQTNSLQGGLKTDLSLAFELSEDDFEQTSLMKNSDAGHVVRYQSVYGPKWKLLRNYYRLYQSVESTKVSPLLKTQLVTPLPEEDPDLGIPYLFGENESDILSTGKTDNQTIDGYENNAHDLPPAVRDAIFPEKMKLAPVLAEMKFLISVDSVALISDETINISDNPAVDTEIIANRKMRLIIDPIVKLWNPFNVRLKFDAFTIRTSHLPLGFIWDINYLSDGVSIGNKKSKQTNLRDMYNAYYGGNFGNWQNWLDSITVAIGDPNGIVLEPGEVKIFSSGGAAPVPLESSMDLVEGWEVNGGYFLEGIDTGSSGDNRILVRHDENDNSEIQDTAKFSVTMTTSKKNSGWGFFRISTYLFGEGGYEQRYKVKGSGSSAFYNTAYYNNKTKNMPFYQESGHTLTSPDNDGYWDLPIEAGEKQYLLAIEMSLKAEDELDYPVPFAQFSPTAYVHTVEQNSVTTALRVGPATTVRYRKINGEADADVEYEDTTNRGYFGSSHYSLDGQSHVPILDIPQAPLFSLGQLQNADTSIYAVDPLLAVGNSFGSPVLDSNQLAGKSRNDYSRLDIPYLLNQALWDECFFSTIAPQESDLFGVKRDVETVFDDILNLREAALNPNVECFNLKLFDAKLSLFDDGAILTDAPDRSAAFILQNGQFNLNSTSVEAWKGLLGSSLGGLIPIVDADSGKQKVIAENDAPISRFSLPRTGSDTKNYWAGYRSLTSEEVNKMALAVVDEIREHGPFLSLSDFVNRDYGNSSDRGLLDRAIEAAGINEDFTEIVEKADVQYLPAPARKNVVGDCAQGSAKYLLQGDVLSLIGQRLATRSDTFRIRSYGEFVDPITNQVEANAWVEAIVQRMPEYVYDQANVPWDLPKDYNINLGRRFVIKSVRFISKEDV